MVRRHTNVTTLILIPWAQTDWQASGRFASATPVEINSEGQQQISQWAEDLATGAARVIYALDRHPADQTATGLARRLDLKVKFAEGLEEVSMGLWEGLTSEELERRFARSYKQWVDDPESICPPEGETIHEGADRLMETVRSLARRHENECFAVVVGPLGVAALRCALEGTGFDSFWEMKPVGPVKYVLKAQEDKARPAA